jgi:tRNA threonylcarbamoyladenosine biosynthesis protein TsaB
MNLLAIDSSASVLSIAAARGDDVFCAETQAEMKHSELVMEMIDSQMKKAGLTAADLDGVLCMGGPGSFTGLRIAYSIAKGLSLSLGIPFVPVATLDCAAFPLRSCGLVLPVIQARKTAFFYTIFRGMERLMPDKDSSAGEIAAVIAEQTNKNEKITITGPGSPELFGALPDELKDRISLSFENRGYAKELIAVAKNGNLFDNDNTAYLFSGPEYIRKTDAELNLTGSIGN